MQKFLYLSKYYGSIHVAFNILHYYNSLEILIQNPNMPEDDMFYYIPRAIVKQKYAAEVARTVKGEQKV